MGTARDFPGIETDTDDERITLALGRSDLNLAITSLRSVIDEIDTWEFQTRLGESPETALGVLATLRAVAPERSGYAETDIELSIAELRLIKNSPNEVLSGIGVEAVVQPFGADRVSTIMKTFGARLRSERHSSTLTTRRHQG